MFGARGNVISRSPNMGKGPPLTPKEKRTVLALRKKEMTLRQIADVMERSLGAVWAAVKSNGTPTVPLKRGRPKKIDDRTHRLIVRTVAKGSGGARTVQQQLQLPVSIRTMQRYIAITPWLKFKRVRRCPMLSRRHKKARLNWAHEHDGLDDFWWANVMFSDEKKWNLDGPDGYRR